MKRLLLILAVAFAGTNSHAQEWKVVTLNDSVTVFVDYTTVAKVGSKRKAWFQFLYKEPQKHEYGFTYEKSLQQNLFDCVEKSNGVIQIAFYDKIDSTGPNKSYSYDREKISYSDPIPGTIGATMQRLVCGWKL